MDDRPVNGKDLILAFVTTLLLGVLLVLFSGCSSPTEPIGVLINPPTPTVTPSVVVSYTPVPVNPMLPRLSIVGTCDQWNPWAPSWTVYNSGGPSGWIDYTVDMVGNIWPPGIGPTRNSFKLDANTNIHIGNYLYGTWNPHYILHVIYTPTGIDITNVVDCSAGVPKVTPTPYPTPVPTKAATPTPTPTPTPTGTRLPVPGPGL